jgi:hypothetical protein
VAEAGAASTVSGDGAGIRVDVAEAACPAVAAGGVAGDVSVAGGLHPGHTVGVIGGRAAERGVTTAVTGVSSGAAVAACPADGGAAGGGDVAGGGRVLGDHGGLAAVAAGT